MMCKLAFRNVKRMAKDYIVYFMTMAVVTALMFSFHTLLFSKDVQNLFQMDAMMSVMTGLATAFIVPIIAWLINYMVRFILEKRSREFGIYLLVGVKKKEIARLYFTENLLLGAGAFLVGMGLGLLFQQILLSIFYSMVQLDYKLHLEWNRNCILMTAACYLCCYLLALFRSQKKFRKMPRDFSPRLRALPNFATRSTVPSAPFLAASAAAAKSSATVGCPFIAAIAGISASKHVLSPTSPLTTSRIEASADSNASAISAASGSALFIASPTPISSVP